MNKFKIIIADPPFSFNDDLKHSDVARGAEANYSTMTISKIKSMPVNELADVDGAVLALWVPSSLLQEGLDIMKAWGFNHKQTYIWVKTKIDPLKDFRDVFFDIIENNISPLNKLSKKYLKSIFKKSGKLNDLIDKSTLFIQNCLSFGMGRLFRQSHEICLIGTNNNGIYKNLVNKSQRSVCFAQNFKHSKKPECLHDSLDLMFPSATTLNKIEIFARRQRPGWLCLGNEAPMTKGEDIFDSLKKIISSSDKELDNLSNLLSSYEETNNDKLFLLWESL